MLLKLKDAAKELSVCVNTLKNYIDEDRIPVISLSERVKLIDSVDLDKFIEDNKKWQSQSAASSITPDSKSVISKSANRPNARDMLTRKNTNAN